MAVNYTRDSFVPLLPIAKTSFVLISTKKSNITTYSQFCEHAIKNHRNFKLGFWHEPTGRIIDKWLESAGLPMPSYVRTDGSATQETLLKNNEIEFAVDTLTYASTLEVNILASFDSKIENPDIVSIPRLYPGLETENWYGVVAGAEADPTELEKIKEILATGLQQEKYQQRLQELQMRFWNGDSVDLTQQQLKTIDFFKKI